MTVCGLWRQDLKEEMDELPYSRVKQRIDVKDRLTPSDEEAKAWNGIRIHPVYAGTLEKNKFAKELKEIAIEPALKIWQSVLRPKHRPPGNRILPRKCGNGGGEVTYEGELVCRYSCSSPLSCFDAELPPNVSQGCKIRQSRSIKTLSEDGADVGKFDLIITFHTAPSIRCSGAGAFASSCKISAYDNRPILGDVNICPPAWPRGRPDNYTRDVIIHEIGHVLGFNPASYAYFIDDAGHPRTKRLPDGTPDTPMISNFHIPSEDVMRTVVDRGESASGFYEIKNFLTVLPSVKEEARKHFNCTKLEGVLMSYDKRFSSFGGHFDTRAMQGDIMSAQPSADAVITPITLAFLKDTGWYHVNESVAQPMKWAKNAGCDFIQKPCDQVIKSRKAANLPLEPFCESTLLSFPSCLASGRYYGYCHDTVSGRLIRKWKVNKKNATSDAVDKQGADEEFETCPLLTVSNDFTIN
ncbi:unnamed protein product [Calicophoron daubneyi]|uniref:Leishmanolysin-like peptidase n=1 Tax=Calicophoron daubneyi TaxID=300641 RepID=A0AAV2TVP4_CALDB